jgi:hypothetical protein
VPVWIALAAPAVPLLAFLPLIRGARAHFETFYARPSWNHTWEFYPWVVGAGIGSTSLSLLIVVASGLGLAWCVYRSPVALPRHEAVAAWSLALLPVFGAALAATVVGAYDPRHGLPAVIGIAAVLAWTAARLSRRSVAIGVLLLVVVGAAVTVLWYGDLSAARLAKRARARAVTMIQATAADERPIVVSQAFIFLHLSHDAPRDLARRLVYLIDWKGALQHHGNDTHERILTGLARRVPLDLREYAGFVASRQEFWLYASRRRDAWIGPVLAREPALRLAERAREDIGVLYLVVPR